MVRPHALLESDDSLSSQMAALARATTFASRFTAHEYVKAVVRRGIISGDLPSGTRLVQTDIARGLDVSTTPVREALRDLASEGMVRFDPHRGAIVPELTAAEVEEVYTIRKALEAVAVPFAMERIDEAAITRMRRLHEAMMEEQSADIWVVHNRDFHMTFYNAADSPRLVSLIGSLQDASVPYIGSSLNNVVDLKADAIVDHGHMVAAAEARDVEVFADLVVTHLDRSLRSALSRWSTT